MHSFHRFSCAIISLGVVAASMGQAALAAEIVSPSPFKDIQKGTALAEAVAFLKSRGVLQGYSDGTFRPDQPVKRAEAVKILVASSSKVTPQQLSSFTKSPFSDIPAGVWYLPFVEAGRTLLKIVDGPPKRTAFEGERSVQEAEFLKLLFLSQDVNVNAYADVKLPLAADVTDTAVWYYPYIRGAIASSILQIAKNNTLSPGHALTRAEVALYLYRFAMYQSGLRTQALLSAADADLANVLTILQEQKDVPLAEQASARAHLAALGANAKRPNVPIVLGALKITEAFAALVSGYRSGSEKDYASAIAQAKKAWGLAEEAKSVTDTLKQLADNVQAIAKDLANEARALQESGQ